MQVLLSIKPEFAFKIFEGTKRFEFRKAIFKREGVTKIIVYASAPISKVIGEFEIANILHDKLDNLWEFTNQYAGISREYFNQYFENKEKGYAIEIKSFKIYPERLCIKNHFGLIAPQSFVYINGIASGLIN